MSRPTRHVHRVRVGTWHLVGRAVVATAVVLAACGDPGEDASEPTIGTIAAPSTDRMTEPVTVPRPSPINRIDDAATSSAPAERIDDTLTIAWIGGSDVELDGRSLPSALAARDIRVDGRRVSISADVTIGPMPADLVSSVDAAVARGADALIVALSPSWTTWNGHDDCEGVAPPHAFYACILTPAAGTDVDHLRSEIARLIATIVASGVPAYVYVLPHSEEALDDPVLSDRLAAAEREIDRLDPAVDRITFVGHVLTRDLAGFREGADFYDMVHPTVAGIERLADHFAAAVPAAFGSAARN